MNKTITITSLDNSFNFVGDETIFEKIEISSINDKKISISFNPDLEKTPNKNKNLGIIGQRDGAWIRLYDKNQVFRDFITEEILVIDSQPGVLIQSLGTIKELGIEYATEVLWKHIKQNNLSFLEVDFLFNYRKKMGKQIKKDLDFLISRKVDLSYSKSKYEQKRNKALKRYLEFSLIKKKIENSWETIKLHLNNKVKYEKK